MSALAYGPPDEWADVLTPYSPVDVAVLGLVALVVAGYVAGVLRGLWFAGQMIVEWSQAHVRVWRATKERTVVRVRPIPVWRLAGHFVWAVLVAVTWPAWALAMWGMRGLEV